MNVASRSGRRRQAWRKKAWRRRGKSNSKRQGRIITGGKSSTSDIKRKIIGQYRKYGIRQRQTNQTRQAPIMAWCCAEEKRQLAGTGISSIGSLKRLNEKRESGKNCARKNCGGGRHLDISGKPYTRDAWQRIFSKAERRRRLKQEKLWLHLSNLGQCQRR